MIKKYLKTILIALTLLAPVFFITGCDEDDAPMKPGGGGKLQIFNPDDGRYIWMYIFFVLLEIKNRIL